MFKVLKINLSKVIPYLLVFSFLLIAFLVINIKEKAKLVELLPLIMIIIVFVFLEINIIKDVLKRKVTLLWGVITLVFFPTILGVIVYTLSRNGTLDYKNKKKFVISMFLGSVCSFLIVVFFNNTMEYVPFLVNNHMNALILFLAPIIFFISMGLLCMFNYEKVERFTENIYVCVCIFNMIPFFISIMTLSFFGY